MDVLCKGRRSAVGVSLKCKQPTTNSHSHRPYPTSFLIIHSRLVKNCAFYQFRRNTFSSQRSQHHFEVGVSRRHRHTDGHCNSMTESAQWADSVKIAQYEKTIIIFVSHSSNLKIKHIVYLLF